MTEDREYYFSQLNDLKEFYISHHDKIMALAEKRLTQFYGAYVVDYSKFFSPIEQLAWNEIRGKGGITLYPQYPVENYFLDFGNPYLKIALELDGKEYHKDKLKDEARDNRLIDLGWTVYRITGKEMYRTNYNDFTGCYEQGYDESETWDNIRYWIEKTGDGILQAIKTVHFVDRSKFMNGVDERSEDFYNLCEISLLTRKSRRI